jgi:hypothetical protein
MLSRQWLNRVAGPVTASLCLVLVAACEINGATALGGVCTASPECIGGTCIDGRCVDPLGDADGDALLNGVELTLGSDPTNPDTDGDGLRDGEELVNFDAPADADRDGQADIFESAVLDADSDCLSDQLDPRNNEVDTDLSVLVPRVCKQEGVCRAGNVSVRCEALVPVCNYSAVPGYSDPETRCDGVDENCDGRVDDAFRDRDGDGRGDCGPPLPTSGLTGISGGGMLTDGKRRVRLVVGGPSPGRQSGWGLSPASGEGRFGGAP